MDATPITLLWGLKRSGNHLLANWLYANHGAATKDELDVTGLHPQLRAGFADAAAGVAFFNNCGWLHSREFSLGTLEPADFERAAYRHRATIFGIEDCDLALVARTPQDIAVTSNVLLLRDPLNNLASRWEAAKTRPQLFRVDRGYIDLYDAYCAELLGYTTHLERKTTVSFNRFVEDRAYRDGLASELGLPNRDEMAETTDFGSGSSFPSSSTSSVATRFQQHPIPSRQIRMLVERDAIREACTRVFGYDLEAAAGGERLTER